MIFVLYIDFFLKKRGFDCERFQGNPTNDLRNLIEEAVKSFSLVF